MSEGFVLRTRGIVSIRENKPFPGRCTIDYTPPGGFIAKSLEVPQAAFLDACRQLADRMTAAPAPEPKVQKTLVRASRAACG